jgi:hypothetical protein
MADDPIIKIDGQEYPYPAFDTLTMDEADVLYGYCKMTLDKLGDLDGFHPGVMMGFIHIAIARVRTELKPKEIEDRVRSLKVGDMREVFDETSVEDDDGPPRTETSDEPEASGAYSPPDTTPYPANGPVPSTGTRLSAIGSD